MKHLHHSDQVKLGIERDLFSPNRLNPHAAVKPPLLNETARAINEIGKRLYAYHLTGWKRLGKGHQHCAAAGADIHYLTARLETRLDPRQLTGSGNNLGRPQGGDTALMKEKIFIMLREGLGRAGTKRLRVDREVA